MEVGPKTNARIFNQEPVDLSVVLVLIVCVPYTNFDGCPYSCSIGPMPWRVHSSFRLQSIRKDK